MLIKKRKTGTILKLDIDHKTIPDYTSQGIDYLNQYLTIEKITREKSKSGNIHIKIKIKEHLTDCEIILWQFALGSDKVRERLNFIRYLNGADVRKWNVLFKETKPLNITPNRLKKTFQKLIDKYEPNK